MENGNGNGEFMVTSVRPGMKREFTMMMKAQSECGEMVMGERRVTGTQNGPLTDKAEGKFGTNDISKKKKKEDENEVSEEEVEKIVAEDGKKGEALSEEVKDGIAEMMNVGATKPPVITYFRRRFASKPKVDAMDEQKEVKETGKLGTISGNRPPVITYFRRRFASKPKVEAVEEQKKVEKEEKLGTEGVKDQEGGGSTCLVSVATSSKLELKMSKKVELKKIPTKLKELLQTGYLEGLAVRYVRGSRVSKPGEAGLCGIIKGSGILCFCDDCKGNQVVSPNQFELHAGSRIKRPPEYIYLENRKCLRDILNVCNGVSSDSLELVIRDAVGHSHAKRTLCLNCKGSMPQVGSGGPILCDSCVALRESEKNITQSTDASSRPSLYVSSSKSSGKTPSSCRPRYKGEVMLTKKDLRLHKTVFVSDVIADGTPLSYFVRGKKLHSGYKLGAGIFCFCCNEVVSPSKFEAHAGCASRRKPYLQIYTDEGVSLHELSLTIKEHMKTSIDESDDVCSICAHMGELLCCDMCPRAFHIACIKLPSIPEDSWICRFCVNMIRKEKFVERNANAIAAGRVAGIDPIEKVKKRCIHTIGASQPEVGGCVLCRGHDFSKSDFGTIILCDQCEKEYHVGCLKERGMDDLKELPDERWFCCKECRNIHSTLQQLVSDGEKNLSDYLLSFIKPNHKDQSSEVASDLNISWRLLHGKKASEESGKWLSDAVSVFHDCFDPIGDSNKSQHDLIPTMIYGRSNRVHDFGGMYCAIQTVNSIVVSAVAFRIFGQEVVEIPLVATSKSFQGKGYFKSLFLCIESLLASLNVSVMVLPAAREAEAIWTSKFGFTKIKAEQLKQYRRDYQLMMFHGTNVLHKRVVTTP
ncbi:hypothetical protein ACH5RR_009813 [Cinchona calisaya]|uniref:PHD-type domain-containing protein n=1 Tax=Cinchona calisaya TaxID=153742 RepID=A0ABD3AF85_9GENT